MRSAMKLVALLVAAVLVLAGTRVMGQAAAQDDLFKQAAAYKVGQSRKALDAIQDQVVKSAANPQERSAMARRLAGLLSDPEATFECKDFACRQLYIIATEAEVPAIAKLLTDEQLSHMARYVLERMAEPAAGAALREALDKTQGRLLIGVINSVGNRRDVQAVGTLKKMLSSPDMEVASAAAAALGRIGGPESLAAIREVRAGAKDGLRQAVYDAYLRCADELLEAGKGPEAAEIYRELWQENQPSQLRLAGLRGLAAAEPERTAGVLLELLKGSEAQMQAVAASFVARGMPGQAVTRLFTERLPDLPAGAQVLLLDALAERGDTSARPAVLAAAHSADENVRAAAIRALGSLGGADDLAMLAEAAARGDKSSPGAREALARLRGQDIDGAILRVMAGASEQVKLALIRSLGERGASATVGALLDLAAKDSSELVRVAALKTAGTLAGQKEYPALVERVLSAQSDIQRDAAEAALGAVASRINDPEACAGPIVRVMGKATVPARVSLLRVLSRIGGSQALEAVRSARADTEELVREAAVRAITEWPDASAIGDMLQIVKSGSETQRILALRGLVGVIQKTNQPAGRALELYKQMLQLCTRAEEKRLVLAGLGELKEAGALEPVVGLLGDEGLRNEAGAALLRIARAVGPGRPAVRSALQKLLESQVEENLKKQAQELLK